MKERIEGRVLRSKDENEQQNSSKKARLYPHTYIAKTEIFCHLLVDGR